MRAGRMLSPDEFWARLRGRDDEVRALFARRPTYALESWTGQRMIDEWSLGDSTYRSLRFDGAEGLQVVVATSNDAASEPARHLLLNLPTTDTGRFTDDLKSRAHYERSEREATGAATLSVSGNPAQFDTWTEDGYTVAGARVDGVALALRTNGRLDGLSFVFIDDIEPYLRGRNDRIGAMRAVRGLDD